MTGITTYQPSTKMLVLSTGERFVADQTLGEFTFKDRKLVTFHMGRVEGTNHEYLVTHKNGFIERLSTWLDDCLLPPALRAASKMPL